MATGMEIPAAIALTSSVLSLVKTCAETTERIVAFVRMTKKLPQEITDLDFTLNFVADVLGNASRLLHSDESASVDTRASVNFLKLCQQHAQTIQDELRGILPELTEDGRSRAWKAIKSIVKRGELKAQMDQLKQNAQLLIVQQIHSVTNKRQPQPETSPNKLKKRQAEKQPDIELCITIQGQPINIKFPKSETIAKDVQRRTRRKVQSKYLDWADEVSSVAGGQRPEQRPNPPSPDLSVVNEDEEGIETSSESDDSDVEDSEITLSASPNDLEAIRNTNFLLRTGCSHLTTSPHQARKILNAADNRAHGIRENVGPIGIRKLRLRTHIYIALAKCSKPADSYLARAELFNRSAGTLANKVGSDCERHCDKVRLDEGHVYLARAKVAKADKRRQLERSAFATFTAVVASFEGSCNTVEHHITHAQGLMGCGKLVSERGQSEAVSYYGRAFDTITRAKCMPYPSPAIFKSLKDVEREVLRAIAKG